MALGDVGLLQGLESAFFSLADRFFPRNDVEEGRFFGLNPWTAILTMAVLGVGVPAAFAYIAVIILTLLNYDIIVNRTNKRRRKKRSEITPEEEYFDWISIVEVLEEKEDEYYVRHKKVDCDLQNLCDRLSNIWHGSDVSKPTLAINEMKQFTEAANSEPHWNQNQKGICNINSCKTLKKQILLNKDS